jgi:hypothetical protein
VSDCGFDEATAGVLGSGGTLDGDERGATTGLSASSVSASEKAAEDLLAGDEAKLAGTLARTLPMTGLE